MWTSTETHADQAVDLPWYKRLRRRAKRHPAGALAYRGAVLLVGGSILLAGLVMFITPGPGWAAVFLGLATLATEFAWAHRWMERAKALFHRITQQATGGSRKRTWLLIGTTAVLLVTVGVVVWQSGVDLPLIS